MAPIKTTINKNKTASNKAPLTKTSRVIKKTDVGSKTKKNQTNNELSTRVKKAPKNTEIGTKIKVMLRCRASDVAPSSKSQILESVVNDPAKVLLKANNAVYCFDQIFDQHSTQEEVYDKIGSPVLKEVFKGYSCTIFAYGQTGTGKTFTMEGTEKQEGIIPRVIKELFLELKKKDPACHVTVSMLELYNEEIRDLLAFSDDQKVYNIYEDGTGVKVQNLREHEITSVERGIDMMKHGVKKRMTAATNINDKSSRSHSIFTITVHMREVSVNGDVIFRIGKLNLVDLAGSENGKNSGSEHLRAREAANINRSLLTLGRVINSLVENTPHVPYRESKLTRLLKESLGDHQTYDEIRSTLDYASHANGICNLPQAHSEISQVTHVATLVNQLEQLDQQLQINYEKQGIYLTKKAYDISKAELQSVKEALAAEKIEKEKLKDVLEESKLDTKRFKEAAKRTRDEKDSAEAEFQEKISKMEMSHKEEIEERKLKEQSLMQEKESLHQKNQELINVLLATNETFMSTIKNNKSSP
ncbi:P-loop containing nucleoside triphosphate hydrolase protein [Mucor mucedo]|uniref:P-loop containing nucleoside triphosphate hydrolase protein n=1 Tax=Mucor mucedo TaxID=29922 RepID=UPI0022201157|nr:P-loop containing nucleoside triphosphate hydrolase protein [Mucor mucedo]KAI7890584.1 P-loop containing nucleoside triphosphate hydrolase protein [Mucor mucedo]